MSETKLYMNRLIHGVTHLCMRTRELAEARSVEPITLMPIRECLGMLERTVDELALALEPPPALPGRRAPEPVREPEESWLVAPEDGG